MVGGDGGRGDYDNHDDCDGGGGPRDGRVLQRNLRIQENLHKEQATSFASMSSQTSIKPLPDSCPILSISEYGLHDGSSTSEGLTAFWCPRNFLNFGTRCPDHLLSQKANLSCV